MASRPAAKRVRLGWALSVAGWGPTSCFQMVSTAHCTASAASPLPSCILLPSSLRIRPPLEWTRFPHEAWTLPPT